MATLYDEQGTQIYAGRGKYSRRARNMIEQRAAYMRNEDEQLVVYVPELQTPVPQRASTLEQDTQKLKRDAQRLGQQLGLGLDEIEVRRETPEAVLIAHLKQMSTAVLAGLDSDQAAKLMQTLTYWILRQNISVHDHDEFVRNMHQLINDMRVPTSGSAVLNRDGVQSREEAVNVHPGAPTSNVYNELWVHAFLPPNSHRCRPSVRQAEHDNGVQADGQIWFDPALMAGTEFVCNNLHQVSSLASFRQGRHGIIRVYLPYNPRQNFSDDNESSHWFRDRGHLQEPHFGQENEPWRNCLERFIDACANIKNTVRTDLRLIIHRGSEAPQEVIL
ncbi:MAG: hypothetical protein GWP25_02930 [Euryarchaeota archaeon]|nr:hypothetical protein [Euryarchaeota archaeon]